MSELRSAPPLRYGRRSPMSDKRREPRVHINLEFSSLEEFLHEYAMNVSQSGVFIRTAEVLPVGTQVRLKFTVIVDDFETIEGWGEVVRSIEAEDSPTPGMGVVFTKLTPESEQVLARLFTRRPQG